MEYSIIYTNTKGNINPNPIKYSSIDLPLKLKPLTDDKLNFIGWLDETETIVTEITEIGDKNLYALWEDKETLIVMYEENAKGDTVTNMPDSVTVNINDNLIVSDLIPLRKGYKFINWNTDINNLGNIYNPNDIIKNIEDNMILYAIWEPNTTKTNLLKYDGNNTNVTNLPDDLKFNSGEEITISNLIPKKLNSVFLNWNTKTDNSGDIIYPNQKLTLSDDSILYANWLELPEVVTIEFDGNGDNVSNVPAPIAVKKGDNVKISEEIPIRPGYKFINWNSNKDGSGVTILPGDELKNVIISEDYFAQWEEEKVSVYFNPNGNNVTNMPDTMLVNKGDNIVISNLIPIREGYIFLNWNTKIDNSGDKIYPNQEIKNILEDINLYAIWYKIPTKIINTCQEYKCICCGCKVKLKDVCNCK